MYVIEEWKNMEISTAIKAEPTWQQMRRKMKEMRKPGVKWWRHSYEGAEHIIKTGVSQASTRAQ